MSAYPVIRREFLAEPSSRGLFGLAKRRRKADDLPRADTHQVCVYRVDGDHVVDSGELSPSDDLVVRADCVSVVDMGRDVPVTVDLAVPSAEASDFTVRVTFACTVTDAKRVVREKLDAASAVLAYLRRDSKLGHIALDRRMGDVNALRVDVAARIRAYTEVREPVVPGLSVQFIDVDVLTPQELGAFEERRRKAETEHLLRRQQAGYDQAGELDDDRHAQRLAEQQRVGRHVADQEDQEFTHLSAVRDQRHRQRLRAEAAECARVEVELTDRVIQHDPLRAVYFAEAAGAIDTRDLAERVNAEERDRVEYARTQRQLEREEKRARAEMDREDRRAAISWDRQREARREDARWDAEREDIREDRKDRRDRHRERREDQHKQMEINLEVLREFAKRGHLDLVNVRLNQLVEDLCGSPGSVIGPASRDELASDKAAASLEGSKTEKAERNDDVDEDNGPVDLGMEVKEEDEDVH